MNLNLSFFFYLLFQKFFSTIILTIVFLFHLNLEHTFEVLHFWVNDNIFILILFPKCLALFFVLKNIQLKEKKTDKIFNKNSFIFLVSIITFLLLALLPVYKKEIQNFDFYNLLVSFFFISFDYFLLERKKITFFKKIFFIFLFSFFYKISLFAYDFNYVSYFFFFMIASSLSYIVGGKITPYIFLLTINFMSIKNRFYIIFESIDIFEKNEFFSNTSTLAAVIVVLFLFLFIKNNHQKNKQGFLNG